MSVNEVIDSIESSSRFMASLAAGAAAREQMTTTADSFASAITLMIERTALNTDTATLVLQTIDRSSFSEAIKHALKGSIAGRVVAGTLTGRDDSHPKVQSLLHMNCYPYRLCQYLTLVGSCSLLWTCTCVTSSLCVCIHVIDIAACSPMWVVCIPMIAYESRGHCVMQYISVTDRPLQACYSSLDV